VSYEWSGGNVDSGILTENIEVISNSLTMPIYLTGELVIEESPVEPGSYDILWLELENPNDFYVSTYATLKLAPPLISKNGQMVFLEPNGKEKVGWIVKYPSDLTEGYIYTYFNNATAYFLGIEECTSIVKEDTNFITLNEAEALVNQGEITKRGSPDIKVKINKPTTVKLGDSYNVSISIENIGSGPLESIIICIKEDCRDNYIGISEDIQEDFELVASNLGTNKVIVVFENVNMDPYTLEINVIKKSIFEKIIDFFKNLFKLK